MTSNFTEKGFVKRSPAEIKEALSKWLIENSFGFTNQTADIQNNILDTFVPCILEMENLTADIANGYAPGYANQFMWEILAQNNGLEYKDESKSSVVLKFSGEAGTYIPANTKTNGDFVTENSVILDTTGNAYVTAYSTSDEEYQANTITEIMTSVPNGVTVTNPTSSTPAQPATTDDELKLNAQRKFRNALISNEDYCTMKLLELKGTSERLINYRITGDTNRNTIECVIGGGDVNEVANVLFNSFVKPSDFNSTPSDNDSNRTVTQRVKFFSGEFEIKWTLPKELKIAINLSLSLTSTNLSADTFKQYLEEKLSAEINSRKLGTPLNIATLNKIMYDGLVYHNVDITDVSRADWSISDDKGKALSFDKNDMLNDVYFDVYTTLSSFDLVLMTIQ